MQVSDREARQDLRAIAAVIIPASAEFDVPGADDPAIQADMVATLGRDTGLVREALDELARLAGLPLASLGPARREAVALELRAKGGAAVAALSRVVLNATIATTASFALSDWSRPALPEGSCTGGWRLVAPRRRPGPFAHVAPWYFRGSSAIASILVEFNLVGAS